ncbi:TPA: amino acid permease [Candidatus Gastranaerophilales bacterium HUM_13]|nr:MAG TPA: amino acid permease [Candidatus Gastranaerophilales bacterium HUM_4]DAA92754.1 MAG TPA: amino acid permease [Candidatus Gastranaerophilales bacterium HUM_5]DAB07884.1 MAG TPA: amino acid permease [Candidatus Gastranaerophilales bacterium HUM_13]
MANSNSSFPISQVLRKMITRKNPDDALAGAAKGGLEKTLGVWDLIILGVGAIIGSGIFAVVGIAAAGSADGSSPGAGPALIISMVIAAIACVFSALCYTEFATMIPVAGGAYTYTFATLGEFAAWIVGWILMLEYAIGFIAVACAWTNHFLQFIKGFSSILPAWLVNPPIWLVNDFRSAVNICNNHGLDAHTAIPHFAGIPFCINLPAIIMIAITTAILVKGTKDSAKMAGIMVAVKLGVIALFVLTGMFYIRPENWTPFAPNGFEGLFMGAFIIFFAYIGFDALATAAEECKNPQKDLPIGILGSLVVTTVVYVMVALVLTGMQPTSGVAIPEGLFKAPMAYAMTAVHQNWAAGLISIGSLAGLTSVLLVMHMAATRVLFAMSRDNFLPRVFQKIHPKFQTPHVLTITVGVVGILGTLILDLNVAASLCNFGTFTSFIIVCVAILILRKVDPDRPRPFKVPFCPWFPIAGIVCCGGLMIFSMVIAKGEAAVLSTELFIVWVIMGALIYASYGYKKNRKAEILAESKEIAGKDEITAGIK